MEDYKYIVGVNLKALSTFIILSTNYSNFQVFYMDLFKLYQKTNIMFIRKHVEFLKLHLSFVLLSNL